MAGDTSIRPSPAPPPPPFSPSNNQSWAAKVNADTDKTLKRLASPTISPNGTHRVKIPDSVFQKGAEIHKDFVIGVFMGKTPAYTQIQNVLNHIWGRGRKIEFHLKPAQRTMMVRIPNDVTRLKIVEQEFWHIGSTMFYVAQWTPHLAIKPPSSSSIPLWAHIKGLPIDLFHQQGLSFVAGLIGEPIETDDSTIRLTNMDVAHVKCRVNCSKALPSKIEIQREDESIITLIVEYPWTPPYCSVCKEMGHLKSRCPSSKWVPVKTASVTSPIHPEPQLASTKPPAEPQTLSPPPQSSPKDTNMVDAIPSPIPTTPPSSLNVPLPTPAIILPDFDVVQPVYFGADQNQSISVNDITHVLGLPAHKPQPPNRATNRPLFDPMEAESQIPLLQTLPSPPPINLQTPSPPIGSPSFFACLLDPDLSSPLSTFPPLLSSPSPNPPYQPSDPPTLLSGPPCPGEPKPNL